jgi:hypothetical protein
MPENGGRLGRVLHEVRPNPLIRVWLVLVGAALLALGVAGLIVKEDPKSKAVSGAALAPGIILLGLAMGALGWFSARRLLVHAAGDSIHRPHQKKAVELPFDDIAEFTVKTEGRRDMPNLRLQFRRRHGGSEEHVFPATRPGGPDEKAVYAIGCILGEHLLHALDDDTPIQWTSLLRLFPDRLEYRSSPDSASGWRSVPLEDIETWEISDWKFSVKRINGRHPVAAESGEAANFFPGLHVFRSIYEDEA